MEEMLVKFLIEYGWQLTLTACSGILALGILKVFHIFDGIEETKRKYFYAGISTLLSIMASSIYLIIVNEFESTRFFIISGAIFTLNQTIYAVYENTGLRACVRKIGHIIVKFIAKNEIDEEKQKLLEKEVEKEEIVENETPKEI